MKKISNITLLLLLATLLPLISGCSNDDDDDTSGAPCPELIGKWDLIELGSDIIPIVKIEEETLTFTSQKFTCETKTASSVDTYRVNYELMDLKQSGDEITFSLILEPELYPDRGGRKYWCSINDGVLKMNASEYFDTGSKYKKAK